MPGVPMTGEELNRVGRSAQDAQDRVDRDVSKQITGRHLARDTRGSVAPDIQVQLLPSSQARTVRLALVFGPGMRCWQGGQRCSSTFAAGVWAA